MMDDAHHAAGPGSKGRESHETLWRDHGWGLSGVAVALLVGAVLVVSCVVQVLG